MKDYEKAEQAVKLLEESDVEYVLAYAVGKKHRVVTQGTYQSAKQCIIRVMARVAKFVYDNGYEEYTAVGELQKMAITAAQLWCDEREKKKEE